MGDEQVVIRVPRDVADRLVGLGWVDVQRIRIDRGDDGEYRLSAEWHVKFDMSDVYR